MEQRKLLTIGTSNLRRLRLQQNHSLRAKFRIQQIINKGWIDPEKLEQQIQELNSRFDVILFHSGNWLYPTRPHWDHFCLKRWDLGEATKYIEKLINIMEKYATLVVITETHPRSLQNPKRCESFNAGTQLRFRRIVKKLLLDGVLTGNVRFLGFATLIKDYFYRIGERTLPWRHMGEEFSKRFLTFSEIHLGEEGNDILQDLTATHLVRISQNYFTSHWIKNAV